MEKYNHSAFRIAPYVIYIRDQPMDYCKLLLFFLSIIFNFKKNNRMNYLYKNVLLLMLLISSSLMFVACGNDEEEQKVNDITLYSAETYNIPVNGNWKSSNDLIAAVKDNKVTAITLGKATISNGKQTFVVTVKSKYNTYAEPCLTWGASVSTVESFMSGYSKQSSSSSTSLMYKGRYKETAIGYSFKNSKLSMTMVLVDALRVEAKEMAGYLTERYVPIGEIESGAWGFVSNDWKTMVIMEIKTGNSGAAYVVAYAEAPETNNAKSRAFETTDLFVQFGGKSIPSIEQQSIVESMRTEFDILNSK